MKKLSEFIHKYKIGLTSLAFSFLNFFPQEIVMGFDNASPFFDFDVTWFRIFNSRNFFDYGGLIFSPALWLSRIGISANINSFIFMFAALYIGLYFTEKIVSSYLKRNTSWIFLITVFSSLLTHFIFAIPTHLFVPAFAGIPALIYLLSSQKKDYLLIPGTLYMLTTIINPIAFSLFSIQAIVISTVITKSKDMIIKRSVTFFVIVVIILQILIVFTSQRFIFLGTEVLNYGLNIANDQKSELVSRSIQDMEIARSSIVNTARFSTGWSKLTNMNLDPLYILSDFIDTIPGIIISLIPIFFWIRFKIKNKTTEEKSKRLLVLYVIGLIISSGYFVRFMSYIPYLSNIFRWSSSKFWPFIFYPSTIFLNEALLISKEKTLKIVTLLSLGALTLPWIFGIVNKNQKMNLPKEYFTVFQESLGTADKNILYLPQPERIYARQYSWHYYGSSFLPYLTKATIYDNGSFGEYQNTYPKLVNDFIQCNIKASEVTNIVIDSSVINSQIEIPSCYDSAITYKGEYLTVIDVEKWQIL